ncbi:unnamed protein product [Orchesella dallaii]|uniref:Galectin n=1 Tax=Orchesella dallaii TaxID=48710 RepID=A0ABP1PK63_9HEXA
MRIFLVLLIFHACHSMLVNNPQLPYVTKLDNGLSIGTKITVTGRTLPGAYQFVAITDSSLIYTSFKTYLFTYFWLNVSRFAINIRHGWREKGGVVLFHFNPRYFASIVLTASHIDGPEWINFGKSRFPMESRFRKGNNFTVEMVCEKDQFNVTVDGVPYLVFEYMLPLEIADMLEIKGVRNRDVEIFSFDISNSFNADTIVLSENGKSDLNFYESETSGNNVTCDSSCPYLLAFLILFVILSAIFCVVILWLTRGLDFCQPKNWFT